MGSSFEQGQGKMESEYFKYLLVKLSWFLHHIRFFSCRLQFSFFPEIQFRRRQRLPLYSGGFLCFLFNGLVWGTINTMTKSNSFLHNLMKTFKFGSSRGNKRNPVPWFSFSILFSLILSSGHWAFNSNGIFCFWSVLFDQREATKNN